MDSTWCWGTSDACGGVTRFDVNSGVPQVFKIVRADLKKYPFKLKQKTHKSIECPFVEPGKTASLELLEMNGCLLRYLQNRTKLNYAAHEFSIQKRKCGPAAMIGPWNFVSDSVGLFSDQKDQNKRVDLEQHGFSS